MDVKWLLMAFVFGAAASVLGGALGGVIVGGKHMGNQLAAVIGAFYGPLAGLAGVVLGLAVVSFKLV
jgi:hypothetical protein